MLTGTRVVNGILSSPLIYAKGALDLSRVGVGDLECVSTECQMLSMLSTEDARLSATCSGAVPPRLKTSLSANEILRVIRKPKFRPPSTRAATVEAWYGSKERWDTLPRFVAA